MPAARLIFYNTARDDGGVDEFDEATWKYFSFKEQSLAALRRRLGEETRVLDLPPGNSQMEFVLVPASSSAGKQWRLLFFSVFCSGSASEHFVINSVNNLLANFTS